MLELIDAAVSSWATRGSKKPVPQKRFLILQSEASLYLIAGNLILGDFKCLIAIDYIEISFLSES